MRKLFYLFSLISLALLTMTSCSNNEEGIVTYETKKDLELAKLYNSIDSLHNEYSESFVTRGSTLNKWARRFLSGTVDACVGALTAETGPVGSFVFGTIASGLYDDYLDYCVRKMESQPRRVAALSSPTSQAIVFNTENATFVDSIGYYHNVVLNEIQSNADSFVDDNGSIDYNRYYNEVIAAARKHGIYENCVSNKQQIFEYIESIIKPLAEIEEGDLNSYLSIIFNSSYNKFNYSNAKTQQLRDVCEKIIYNDLSVAGDDIIEYGTKVNYLINSSNVSSNTKTELKVANNIAVNSSLYWKNK